MKCLVPDKQHRRCQMKQFKVNKLLWMKRNNVRKRPKQRYQYSSSSRKQRCVVCIRTERLTELGVMDGESSYGRRWFQDASQRCRPTDLMKLRRKEKLSQHIYLHGEVVQVVNGLKVEQVITASSMWSSGNRDRKRRWCSGRDRWCRRLHRREQPLWDFSRMNTSRCQENWPVSSVLNTNYINTA